jgi:hypothetical protein
MTELHRETLGPYQDLVEAGVEMVVAEASLRFLAPAGFDDEIDLRPRGGLAIADEIIDDISIRRAGTDLPRRGPGLSLDLHAKACHTLDSSGATQGMATQERALGRVGARALASVVALGLVCALGAAGAVADGSDGASASTRFAACGEGFPKPPPKRYRFRIAGTTTSEEWWIDGRETYLYRGVMKRVICRGTKVEYWQTRGTVTQTFKDIAMGPPECEFTGHPPHHAIGNAPTQSRPLRRFDVDVGFEWSGNKYQTSVINPRRGNPVAHGTARCPGPPAANGATVPVTFRHVSTDLFTVKGQPRRVVKGRIVNYLDFTLYRYSFHWKLTAIG